MACSKLSEINSDSHQWSICVLVSRLWHFRGGTDDGPIKHTDLVLLDSEGTHMYAQVPSTSGTADRLKDVLEEGKVYVIKKFLCNRSRPSYRPVESAFMVQFTKYTVVEPRPGIEDSFPFCTYSLTPFVEIPKPSQTPDRFIDVIGKITMVSDVIPVQSMYQTKASNTRTIMLVDLMGNELRIILWGERAVEFDGDAVRVMGAKEPVIAIFVGMLSKTTRGVRSLSGSAACRWYIDEDIPDINSFRASLGEQFVPLVSYVPTGPDALTARSQEQPTDKTVKQLIDLDPFVDMDKRFFCTVTVDSLGTDSRWWFASCGTCRKSARHNGYQYKCSDETCSSVEADPTYCVSIFASDSTGQAEFVFFDKVAAGAVGKPLLTVFRQKYPACGTLDEMASVARHDVDVPAQIKRLVGLKYKLMVSISKKWKIKNAEDLSFQVNRIEETFKPDLPPLTVDAPSGSGSTTATGVCGKKLPVLEPVFSPGLNTPTRYGLAVGSHASQTHTPPSVSKITPATPSPCPVAPMRGTKRSLFAKSSKAKLDAVLQDGSSASQDGSSASQEPMADVLHDSAVIAGDKDLDSVNTKPKRITPNGKGSGANKKQK